MTPQIVEKPGAVFLKGVRQGGVDLGPAARPVERIQARLFVDGVLQLGVDAAQGARYVLLPLGERESGGAGFVQLGIEVIERLRSEGGFALFLKGQDALERVVRSGI